MFISIAQGDGRAAIAIPSIWKFHQYSKEKKRRNLWFCSTLSTVIMFVHAECLVRHPVASKPVVARSRNNFVAFSMSHPSNGVKACPFRTQKHFAYSIPRSVDFRFLQPLPVPRHTARYILARIYSSAPIIRWKFRQVHAGEAEQDNRNERVDGEFVPCRLVPHIAL